MDRYTLVVVDQTSISNDYHGTKISTAIWNHSPEIPGDIEKALETLRPTRIRKTIFIDLDRGKELQGWVRFEPGLNFERTQFPQIRISEIELSSAYTRVCWTVLPTQRSTELFPRDEQSPEFRNFQAAIKKGLSVSIHRAKHLAHNADEAYTKLSESTGQGQLAALSWSGIYKHFDKVGKHVWNISPDIQTQIKKGITGRPGSQVDCKVCCLVDLVPAANGWQIDKHSKKIRPGYFNKIKVDIINVIASHTSPCVTFHWHPDEFTEAPEQSTSSSSRPDRR